ncbi:MAG: O-antigen polymerase [Terracidiphilus sp.]
MTVNTATRNLRYRWLSVRTAATLPFFCHPVKLFCFIWIVMLAALSIHVSDSSYPTLGIPLRLFAISLVSMVAGYLLILLLNSGRIRKSKSYEDIQLDIRKLRIINLIFLMVAAVIVAINLKTAGLPPAFSFFSLDTKDYLEYGNLKQILFPLLVAILVNVSLDPSYRFKLFFGGFASIVMGLYLTRLNLMFAAFQIIVLFALTSRVRTRKLYVVAAISVLCALMLANVLGNNRTSRAVFMEFLQIKSAYSDAPMPFLWAASYFSIPISDMSWIALEFPHEQLHLSSLYPILPGFWTPEDPNQTFIDSDARIIDKAHTYLSTYFMDASYLGVVIINLLIGLASGYFMTGHRTTSPLVFAVLLAAIMFLFFFDLFTPLSTLFLVVFQQLTEKYTLRFHASRENRQRELAA